MGSHESGQPHTGIPDLAESSTHGQTDASCSEAEPEADKENSFHLPEVTRDTEDGHLSNDSPEEPAPQDPAEQEEEWEDDDEDEESEGQSLCVFFNFFLNENKSIMMFCFLKSSEVPSKTPAFVREKRRMFHPDPQASPSVLKNIQARQVSPPATLKHLISFRKSWLHFLHYKIAC